MLSWKWVLAETYHGELCIDKLKAVLHCRCHLIDKDGWVCGCVRMLQCVCLCADEGCRRAQRLAPTTRGKARLPYAAAA